MADVARHELEAVERRRGDLEIRVGQRPAALPQRRLDLARSSARRCSADRHDAIRQVLGSLPAPRDARETLLGSSRPQAADLPCAARGDDRRDIPPVPANHDNPAGFGLAHDFREAGLGLDNRYRMNWLGAHRTCLTILALIAQ